MAFVFFLFKCDCIAVLTNENRFTLIPIPYLFGSGALFTGKDDGFPTNLLYRKRYLVAKSLMLSYKSDHIFR